jgi:hypothetical protein
MTEQDINTTGSENSPREGEAMPVRRRVGIGLEVSRDQNTGRRIVADLEVSDR